MGKTEYMSNMNAWDTLLRCTHVLEDHSLAFAEEEFRNKRYGFKVSEFKVDQNLEYAARTIQKFFRKR